MKLVYSKSRCNQSDVVHRFDVLGELLPSDLEVLKNSFTIFFKQLEKNPNSFSIVVLDISESITKVNESLLQVFVTTMKNFALASQVILTIAQSDIESMHAEQKAIEQALLNRISLLEHKVNLMESVKNKIIIMKNENQDLREKLKECKSKNGARTIFEKLWGES